MKIEHNFGENKTFGELFSGEAFIDSLGEHCMKINSHLGDCKNYINAVSLEDGTTGYFHDEDIVTFVHATLIVV